MLGRFGVRWTIAFAAALALAPLGSVRAEPGLWLAESGAAAVYVFGTYSGLERGVIWRTAKIETALAEARDVWLEIADPGDKAAVARLLLETGLDPEHPLSRKLSKTDFDRVSLELQLAGAWYGAANLTNFRPWLAATMATVSPGFDYRTGVDLSLRAEAMAAGKRVRGLDSLEQRIKLFAGLSPYAEMMLLATELDDRGPHRHAVFDAWFSGDVDTMRQLVQDSLPLELWRTLFTERNAIWADRISEMLDEPGVVFVGLNAAHLAGENGVLRLLSAHGITIERIQ